MSTDWHFTATQSRTPEEIAREVAQQEAETAVQRKYQRIAQALTDRMNRQLLAMHAKNDR